MKTSPGAKASFVPNPEHPFEERWELAQRRYGGTIHTFARNCVNQLPGYEIADIEQELLVILWKAVLNYDPNKGASFNTLFQGSARNRCISLIRTASTKSRTGIVNSLDVEAVGAAVDELFAEQSTEDRCLDRMELQDYVSQHGVDVFFDEKRKQRVA